MLSSFSMKCSAYSAGSRRPVDLSLTPVTGLRFSASLMLLAALMSVSCSTYRKLSDLRKDTAELVLALPDEDTQDVLASVSASRSDNRDTLMVKDLSGNDVFIMKAVKDELTGEMVATEELQAAVISARFRNVAERFGKVELRFQLEVPERMQDKRWQLRLFPDMFILTDSVRLESLIVTGDQYRDIQLRGYERYERFISKIISDNEHFINHRKLDIFIKRNMPELYAFKTDSSYVSEAEFESRYGVDEQEAVEHYTNKLARRLNDRRRNNRDNMFARYVKSPIISDSVRLDTIIRQGSGDLIYEYVQTVDTRPGLRKIDIVVSGDIYEQERLLYRIPQSKPLTFYVSSVSAFVDPSERYITKVISRNAVSSTECNIDFGLAESDIKEELGNNTQEISRIKSILKELLTDDSYDLDSVTVLASASPEGSQKINDRLSLARAKSSSKYFERYVERVKDSLQKSQGVFIEISDDMEESKVSAAERNDRQIVFRSGSIGEDWAGLDILIECDTVLTEQQKSRYGRIKEEALQSSDERESLLKKESSYDYIRNSLFPKLRRVRFNFALSRKGMIKDTVHTTQLDTSYMRAVQLVKDHDYKSALEILAPYEDINTAVAYMALDRNISALKILEDEERTAAVNYMLAILYSRMGDDQKAVESYLHSCEQDRSYVYRGNLDPEINALTKKYELNLIEEDY